MNRNVESHFSQTPTLEMPRSTFDRSFTHKTSFNVGDLVPFYVDEVYPGDTFRITTSKVVRLQTMLTPIMDNIYLDTYFFFVPNRLVWEHWQNLMGQNDDSAWIPQIAYTTPTIKTNTNDRQIHTGMIADYMGLPVGVSGVNINALPIRGYHLIWNEFFRDENLQAPLNIYKGDSQVSWNVYNAADDLSEKYPWPRKAARYHDYFSSCLPAPQKGPDVNIPIAGTAPVGTGPEWHDMSVYYSLMGAIKGTNPAERYVEVFGASQPAVGSSANLTVKGVNSTDEGLNNNLGFHPNNLYAYAGVGDFTATVNNMRQAFQIQKLYERDAIGGSRYIEILKAHFGVTSPDARLQRPEYLGGNRIALNVHEVVNTSQGTTEFLGNLGAMSHTSDVHEDFIKSFVEHGFVIGVMVARYDNSYCQGVERFWSRSDRFSYYWPSLAHLGNMAVLRKELYFTGTAANDNEVFGYQEAWADLRYKPNIVTGEMRPGISNSLASWHLSDYYASTPYLSSGWIESDKGIVDRCLAVTSSNANQLFADIFVQNMSTRVLPLYSIPGLIDHF